MASSGSSNSRPRLPAPPDELRIHNLDAAGARIDTRLVRHERGVSVDALCRGGDAEVLVVN